VRVRLPRPPAALIAPIVLLAFAAQLELWTRLPGSKPLLAATAIACTLPLLAVHTYPWQVFAVVMIAIDVEAVFAREATRLAGAPLFAGLAAGFLVALFASRRDAITALAFGYVTVALVARDAGGLGAGVVSFLLTGALLIVVWGMGFALQQRRIRADDAEARATRAEHDRDVSARLAVAEERARIARELHDVVAHAVSTMVLRAGVVRHKLPEALAEEGRALRDVEQTGRSALAEMRQLLGVLRAAEDTAELAPQPGIPTLPALAERITDAGLAVDIQVHGEPVPLPAGLDRTAFRIVQEGLTNALKHAHATRADVRLSYSASQLRIEIRDDGTGPQATDGLGHGLVGIRERVKIYHGEIQTGAAPDGGFILLAQLPIKTLA
jgi:signal transduction histidine kinase